jgi:phage tail-like protein
MSVIQDQAFNPLVSQQAGMLGFIPPALVEEDLNLKMYLFILENIRVEDQIRGDRFLERFLEGPQSVWKTIHDTIRSIPGLWDVAKVDAKFLPFLKKIVGWTKEIESIPNALDTPALRRLLSTSVAFWKQRGPDEALLNLMSQVTGARLRMWDWFDFRFILDETALGEDHEGRDPHMISLPGPPNVDERRYNIRIVDDGTLNHQVVRDIAALTRPSLERVEISYIGFLDLFETDDDDSQWAEQSGDILISGGTLSLDDDLITELAYVSLGESMDWSNYVATWRIRGDTDPSSEFGALFYRTGPGDFYVVMINITTNTMRLVKFVGSVPTQLGFVNFTSTPFQFLPDVYYAIRVEVVPEGSNNQIRVFLDSELQIEAVDGSHAEGTLGVLHTPGATLEMDELEMFFNPLVTDTIDIQQ